MPRTVATPGGVTYSQRVASRVLVVCILGLALAGCGGAAKQRVAGEEGPDVFCGLTASNGDASVVFSGDGAGKACAAFRQWRAKAGSFWTGHNTAARGDVVCRLTRDKHAKLTLTVLDVGGQYVGNEICAAYAAAGWGEL
jgi:hypothetical protein